MRCKDVQEILMDRVSGRLDPERAKEVDMHLEICPKCQKARVEFSLLRDLLVLKAEELIIPDNYGDVLWANITRRLEEGSRSRRRIPRFVLIPAMAVILLFISTTLYLVYKPGRGEKAPSMVTAPKEIIVSPSERPSIQKKEKSVRPYVTKAGMKRSVKVKKYAVRKESSDITSSAIPPEDSGYELESFPIMTISMSVPSWDLEEMEADVEEEFPMGSLTPGVLSL